MRFPIVVGGQIGYCLGSAIFHTRNLLSTYSDGARIAWLEHSHHATLAVGILKCHVIVVDAHIYHTHHHSGAGVWHSKSGAGMRGIYICCRALTVGLQSHISCHRHALHAFCFGYLCQAGQGCIHSKQIAIACSYVETLRFKLCASILIVDSHKCSHTALSVHYMWSELTIRLVSTALHNLCRAISACHCICAILRTLRCRICPLIEIRFGGVGYLTLRRCRHSDC